MRANDTELPNLEYDFEKREISFEWEGMFARFYDEAAMLEKREHKTMTEAMEWLDGKYGSIAGAMAVSQKAKQAWWCSAKALRRDRIKKWYLENHNRHFEDDDFEEEDEDKALDAIQYLELHGDLARSAEDTESRQAAETNTQSQEMLEMLGMIRGAQGSGGNAEDALTAMLMGMANGSSGYVEIHDGDFSEEWNDDDDDDNDLIESNEV